MALALLRPLIGIFLLAGFQHGTSGSEPPEDRQGAMRLPDGSILTPYGQGQGIAPQNPPGYSPALVPYPYYPEPSPYYPEPYPYYPEPYPYIPEQPVHYPNPLPPYHPPKPKSNFGRLLLLLYVFSGALKPATTTTTTTTASTAFPGTCVWGAWSGCSGICRGTRTRQRMCTGNTQFDSQICNTETGFRPDGKWYRASNCYEYFWGGTGDVTELRSEAEQACTNLKSRLASTGLRDDSVRTAIVTAFAVSKGIANLLDAHVGISDASVAGDYVWSDGYEGDPTFWRNAHPADTGTDCIALKIGEPYGLISSSSCTASGISHLCERAAQ